MAESNELQGEIKIIGEAAEASISVKLRAILVGSIQLMLKDLEEIDFSSAETPIDSDEDFVTALYSISGLLVDPTFTLACAGMLVADSYEAGAMHYNSVLNGENLDFISVETRREMIRILKEELAVVCDTLLKEFHEDCNGFTVFITGDGRIAIGNYLKD